MTMHDDSPWKPPADGDVTAPSPTSPSADGEFAAPATPPRPPEPSLPGPSAAGQVPTLPPANVPPLPPQATAPSAWQPGGAADQPVLAPPAPVAPAAAPPSPWAAGQSATSPGSAPPQLVQSAPPERPRRSRLLVGAAAAAVVAVGGAGIFAVANMTGSTVGGAATPDELGVEFLLAVENEDVLGVIDVLVPGERDSLGEPFVELVSELQRLDVLAPTDLSQISGIDIELSGETVQVRPTNVPDIVNVDMRADVVVSVDGAELPIGDLITDNMPDDMLTEMRGTRVTQNDEIDMWLTAVEQDGQWYFSLLHSAAELARRDLEPGTMIPAEGVGATGADSPEAAVDQLLAGVEQLDITAMIRSLNPGEAAALQRYAPLFLDDAEAALAQVPLTWEITNRQIRIVGSGDTRTAFVDAITIEGVADGSPFSLGYADGCVDASYRDETFNQCGTGFDPGDVTGVFGDNPDVAHLIDTIDSALADLEQPGLELRQYDGAWYVSPIGTMTEAMLNFLRALDRQELDAIIDAVPPAIDSITESFFGAFDDLAGSSDFTIPGDASAEPAPVEPAPVEPASTVPPGEPTDSFGSDPWLECYEKDAADATTCFESYVASGQIDRSMVPVVLRHPECGYAELAWSNEVYSLPDDEFVAAAESARACFLALVDTGDVSSFELPSEITHLECFEGRNWYQVFDDPAFDARYYECIGSDTGG